MNLSKEDEKRLMFLNLSGFTIHKKSLSLPHRYYWLLNNEAYRPEPFHDSFVISIRDLYQVVMSEKGIDD